MSSNTVSAKAVISREIRIYIPPADGYYTLTEKQGWDLHDQLVEALRTLKEAS